MSEGVVGRDRTRTRISGPEARGFVARLMVDSRRITFCFGSALYFFYRGCGYSAQRPFNHAVIILRLRRSRVRHAPLSQRIDRHGAWQIQRLYKKIRIPHAPSRVYLISMVRGGSESFCKDFDAVFGVLRGCWGCDHVLLILHTVSAVRLYRSKNMSEGGVVGDRTRTRISGPEARVTLVRSVL